jgi:Protein of unknown function (DUF1579)
MRYRLIGIAWLMLLLPSAPTIQAQMQTPKPGPELKKLDYFAGAWTLDGDTKPGPMGPGGKMTMTERNQWMEGGFFVVSHSDFKSSMGNGTAISFLGYDPEEKVYTYDEFNSMGEAEHSKGTLEGDTWTWSGDEKVSGQVIKGRFTMKVLSPTSYSFKFEMSPDGAQWTTVMDGNATKSSKSGTR